MTIDNYFFNLVILFISKYIHYTRGQMCVGKRTLMYSLLNILGEYIHFSIVKTSIEKWKRTKVVEFKSVRNNTCRIAAFRK